MLAECVQRAVVSCGELCQDRLVLPTERLDHGNFFGLQRSQVSQRLLISVNARLYIRQLIGECIDKSLGLGVKFVAHGEV